MPEKLPSDSSPHHLHVELCLLFCRVCSKILCCTEMQLELDSRGNNPHLFFMSMASGCYTVLGSKISRFQLVQLCFSSAKSHPAMCIYVFV